MVVRPRGRLPLGTRIRFLEHFVGGTPARTAAGPVGVNRHTATLFFSEIRGIIAERIASDAQPDESTFGGRRKGKKGRGAGGKAIVFGLLKRGGRLRAVMIAGVRRATLLPISTPQDQAHVVHTDAVRSHDTLDVSGFRHSRIDHGTGFEVGQAHINGIENFWRQAKRHLRRFNGIPRPHFPLFLAGCEWRFNYGPASRLQGILSRWANIPTADPDRITDPGQPRRR